MPYKVGDKVVLIDNAPRDGEWKYGTVVSTIWGVAYPYEVKPIWGNGVSCVFQEHELLPYDVFNAL